MDENTYTGIRWEHLIDTLTLENVVFLALIVNVFIFLCTVWWVRRQVQIADINNHFQIREKIARAWRKFRDESEEKKDFEFIELLNLLETVSKLYNSRIIHGSTRKMVKNYLSEVLPCILTNEYTVSRLKNTRSGPETYSEIKRFARSNNIDWPL